MLRGPAAPQPGKVQIVFTLKKRFFSENDGDGNSFQEQFQKLLTRLSNINLSNLIEEWFED